MKNGVLKGLRVVEGSAFVAAPLGGMTLAQLGADVIRFDPIGGGLDYGRWPITSEGSSLFWAGMNNIDALEKEFNWDDLKGESPKAQPTKTDKQGRIIAKFNDIA